MVDSKTRNRPRRKWVGLVVAAIALVVMYLAWDQWTKRGWQSAVGIYMAGGGRGYLVIEPGRFGTLKVREGIVLTGVERLCGSPTRTSLSAAYRNGWLLLSQNERYGAEDAGGIPLRMALAQSPLAPGDWDLVAADLIMYSRKVAIPLLSKDFWHDLVDSASKKEFFETASHALERNPLYMRGELAPATTSTLPQFLHRVDDPRLANYFSEYLENGETTRALELARAMAADRSSDPYLGLHRIELEASHDNSATAERLWEKWQSANGGAKDKMLADSAKRVEKNVSMALLRARHPDWEPYADAYAQDPMDLKTSLEWMLKCLDADRLLFRSGSPLVPPLRRKGYRGEEIPSFLLLQTTGRLARIVGTFRLFEGKREESLRLFASAYRVGQSFNADGCLISRIIGYSLRSSGVKGMALFLLNACEAPKEITRFWAMLERLRKTPGQENGERLSDGEIIDLERYMALSGGLTLRSRYEAMTRHEVADVMFEILRVATAARARQIASGQFPKSLKDFAPYFPNGLPTDDFASSAPLRFVSQPDGFGVYSIGPDKEDDGAALAYDPTNGTTSRGDVLIHIPLQREFPFPRTGVRAANAGQLLQQFPNGLPEDVFTFKSKPPNMLPLSILESTTTCPLAIFSFGPCRDEEKYTAFAETASGATAATTPSLGRSLQKVFLRDFQTPPAHGHYTLKPAYDPTNGVISDGSLFVEIPPP